MKTCQLNYAELKPIKVRIPYKGGYHMLKPEEIIRLEALSNYTFIHVAGRKPILMAKVLSAYESLFEPFGFIRTHRSHLINPTHIRVVHKKGTVEMDDESQAEVSRRRRKEISNVLSLKYQVA